MTLSSRFILICSLLPFLLGGCASVGDKLGLGQPIQNAFEEPPHYLTVCGGCETDLETLSQIELDLEPDIWDRIRDGFKLDLVDNKRVEEQLKWFARNPKYMHRVANRGQRYLFHIVEELEKRNLPAELALLPIVESAFDPFAYSHSRASGVWQFVPRTGKSLGLKQNWWYDGRRDITAATSAALTYLQRYHKRFDDDWLLALAAYNSGGGNVNKALRKNRNKGKPTDFWNLNLPRETKAYVPKLIALAKLIKNPQKYGLTLPRLENKPYFTLVETGSQIDLAQAANLAEIDMSELYLLNPAFNRWATDPKGPHHLLVPYEKAEIFRRNLDDIPSSQRITWDRYTVKKGDTLSTIALKMKISTDSLQEINNIRGHNIRVGQKLMVPVATKSAAFYAYTETQRLIKKRNRAGKREKGHKVQYTVRAGDSFWSIAKQHGVKSTKVAKWNNMAVRDPLRIGQTLTIWTPKAKYAKGNNKVIRKIAYRVRSGDSIHRIADKFQIRVKDILRWNQVDPSKYLQPGQKLTLFVDVKNNRG